MQTRLTRAEKNAKAAAYMRKWSKTPSGQASQRASRRRYSATVHGQEVQKSYRQSENGKLRRQAGQAKYSKTPKGRATQKRFWKGYVEPEHLKEARRIRGRKYNKTPQGRAIRVHHQATRRAIKKGASVAGLRLIANWIKQWKSATWVRCYWCMSWFRPKVCHNDHIIQLSKGGIHSVENMCVSCNWCNRKKQAKLPWEWNKVIDEPVLL